MAKIFAGLLAGLGALPVQPPEAGQGVNSTLRVHRNVITLAAQPTTDTQLLARIPNGQLPIAILLTSSVSLGAATIAIGNATTPAKYKAAGTFTAVDTPTLFMLTSAADDAPLTVDEEVLLTVATAALPGAGILVSHIITAKP